MGETAAATATMLQLGLLAREDFLASAITFSLQCDFVVLVWPQDGALDMAMLSADQQIGVMAQANKTQRARIAKKIIDTFLVKQTPHPIVTADHVPSHVLATLLRRLPANQTQI